MHVLAAWILLRDGDACTLGRWTPARAVALVFCLDLTSAETIALAVRLGLRLLAMNRNVYGGRVLLHG